MKTLIIGGTRFIGRCLARQSIQRGNEVVLFNRGKTPSPFEVETLVGDVDTILELGDILRSRSFDTVIHCIALTENHGQDLASIFRGTSTRLLVLGSMDCYEAFQRLVREEDPGNLPVHEEDPTSLTRHYWRGKGHSGGDEYDKNLMMDALLAVPDLDVAIFRLPMVYGPHDHQYAFRHGPIIRRLLDRRPRMVLSHRESSQVFPYDYVENVAAAILHAQDLPTLPGRIYNLCEEKSRTRWSWIQQYARVAGQEIEIELLPEELLSGRMERRNRPPQVLTVDAGTFQRETGFRPPVSLDEAMSGTLEYAFENPEVLGPKPDYEREDELIEKYKRTMGDLPG